MNIRQVKAVLDELEQEIWQNIWTLIEKYADFQIYTDFT